MSKLPAKVNQAYIRYDSDVNRIAVRMASEGSQK